MFAAAHRFIKVTPFYLFHTKIPSKISLTYHQVAPNVRPSVHAGMAICPAARRAYKVKSDQNNLNTPITCPRI